MVFDLSFYKFPSTPYLYSPANQKIREDKVLSEKEAEWFLSNRIVVEEKIDGANLGISFDSNGVLQLQNRGHYLYTPYIGQWKPLERWLKSRFQSLFDILVDDYIIFGEWCYYTHSIYYNSLPDWFIGFDVFDKNRNIFLSVKERNDILARADLPIVPYISEGYFNKESLDTILKKSTYGDERCEGLYLRINDSKQLIKRAKYVRSDFSQSIEKHWTKKKVQKNKLRWLL